MMFGRGRCNICGNEFIQRPNQHLCTAHQEGYDRAMDDVENWLIGLGLKDLADDVYAKAKAIHETGWTS
jgi:hypothetical protein